jgi:hypothetical protein
MPLAPVTVQLDARTQQSPAQVEIAAFALFQKIQPRAYRQAIILGLQSIDDQMARAPAQRRLCLHLTGIEEGQRPAWVVGALCEQREQRTGIAEIQIRGGIHLERRLRIDAPTPEVHAAFPCRRALRARHLHVAQLDRGAGQIKVALVEVATAQRSVHVDVAAHVQPRHLGTGVAPQQPGRAMANAAIGIEGGITAE